MATTTAATTPSATERRDEVVVPTHDIDRELMDVADRESVMRDEREQVVHALAGLQSRISRADDVPAGISRDLSGDEEPIADAIGVPVVRRGRQACLDLVFVHATLRLWAYRARAQR